MALLDIDTVKAHLRAFHNDEDATIAIYQAAAENIVTEHLDRKVLASGSTLPAPTDPDYDVYTMLITPAITAAILLLVGELFDNRDADPESKGDAVLPRSVRSLLAPWRVWRSLPEVVACG